jgi:hypothetical protein
MAARFRRTADAAEVRANARLCAPRVPPHHHGVGREHAPLSDHGADGRAGDTPPRAIDKEEVEQDVGAEAGPRDDERCRGVLQTAQEPRAGEDGEHGRDAEHRDGQVGVRLFGHSGRRAEQRHDGWCENQPGDREPDSEQQRQPHAVDAHRHGAPLVSRTPPPGGSRGRGVGQENHEADDRLQHGAGDSEARERFDAEVPDHGRIGQKEERLGDECPERGHRQAHDLAINRWRRWRGHVPTLAAATDGADSTLPSVGGGV